MTKETATSAERLTKAIGYLRSQGGFSLDIKVGTEGQYIATAHSKELGGYSFSIGIASVGASIDEAQGEAIVTLGELVYNTKDNKPVQPAKSYKSDSSSSYGKSSSGSYAKKSYGNDDGFDKEEWKRKVNSPICFSTKGLKDNQFKQAQQQARDAGFVWDKDRMVWAGGDPTLLTEGLQKRVDGIDEGEQDNELETPPAPRRTKAFVGKKVEELEEDDIPF